MKVLLLYFAFVATYCSAIPNFSTKQKKSRIVGGGDLNIWNAPYQVSLQLGGRHFCGGSILSEVFVLTSAYCMVDIPRDDVVTVHPGISDLSDDSESVRVVQINIHPDYVSANYNYYNYDIAILRVAPTLTLGVIHNTAAISLPEANVSIPANTELMISGWGVSSSGIALGTLQSVTLNSTEMETCESWYEFEMTTLFCADSCVGESGGPIVVNDLRDPALLVGIVAFGDKQCYLKPQYPGVYTSTGNVDIRSFITAVTNL